MRSAFKSARSGDDQSTRSQIVGVFTQPPWILRQAVAQPCLLGSVRARATALGRRGLVGYRAAPHKEGRTKMRCLECGSEAVTERPERTAQGYPRFRCRACGKQFNERSGSVLNRTQYPSDVIALVVLWRLRYKLALRDLPEMFAVRGIVFSHEAVREWEAKLTPALVEDLR